MKTEKQEIKQSFGYGPIFKGVDKICGKDDLRPIMKHAFIKDGCVVATDAHQLVIINLKFFGLNDEAIELLEGKYISKSNLTLLGRINKNHYWTLTEQGFKVNDLTYNFSKVDGKFPNYNAVIPDTKVKIDTIGMDSNFLLNIQKIYHYQKGGDFGSNLKIVFHGETRAILIKSIESNYFTGLIMPKRLND